MRKLSSRTKRNIERSIGLPMSKITDLSVEDEINYIEKRSGKKLTFNHGVRDARKVTRGNVLLSMGRIRTIEDVNKKLDKIK